MKLQLFALQDSYNLNIIFPGRRLEMLNSHVTYHMVKMPGYTVELNFLNLSND